jgi:predicted ATP-grasp superfamily ATP-dependent carboligase
MDAGNTSAYHVIRTLAKAGHEAHLSSSEDCIWFASRYCSKSFQSPPGEDAERFLRFLLALIRRWSYDLLIACGDLETEIMARHRAEIASYVKVFMPGDAVHDILLRKNAACQHATRIGVPTPMLHYPAGLEAVRDIAGRIMYPAVVKGELGSSGSHVRYAFAPEELIEHYREVAAMERPAGGRPTVQEYIPGPGYVVHCLFHEGRALAICSHRKDREYPVSGGVTSAGTTVHEPELDRAAIRFLESLRWNGLVKLDFKRDSRDGTFKFLELDGRVSASIDITRAAGADQVLMLCDLAAGKHVTPQLDYRAGVRYCWLYPRDIMSLMTTPWEVPARVLEIALGSSHCDLDFKDVRPLLRVARSAAWYVKQQLKTRTVWKQERQRRALALLVSRQSPRDEPRRPLAAVHGKIRA